MTQATYPASSTQSYEKINGSFPSLPQAKREPLLAYTGKCECGGPIDLIAQCAAAIFCSIYGGLTCCDCCSGDCMEYWTYNKRFPCCQTPLEPINDMDTLPETSPEEIQVKLEAARLHLKNLDQTLSTRRKTHRCVSASLCLCVCPSRTLVSIAHSDPDGYGPSYNQSLRPQPNTKLDLTYQFTLPCLEQDTEMNRRGLRQFLSAPEVQRMIDLETTIIPSLEKKIENT